MTDNDIKAMEAYRNSKIIQTENGVISIGDILDLINRQKAEIERLSEAIYQGRITTEIQMRAENHFQWLQLKRVERARAEAITEFAERFKEKANKVPQHHFTLLEIEFVIDQLIKDFKGEKI